MNVGDEGVVIWQDLHCTMSDVGLDMVEHSLLLLLISMLPLSSVVSFFSSSVISLSTFSVVKVDVKLSTLQDNLVTSLAMSVHIPEDPVSIHNRE